MSLWRTVAEFAHARSVVIIGLLCEMLRTTRKRCVARLPLHWPVLWLPVRDLFILSTVRVYSLECSRDFGNQASSFLKLRASNFSLLPPFVTFICDNNKKTRSLGTRLYDYHNQALYYSILHQKYLFSDDDFNDQTTVIILLWGSYIRRLKIWNS